MRWYLAGPVSGVPDFNRPAFAAEATRLRALGYEIVNPLEVCAGIEGNWSECMKRDIAAMLTCDGIALLPGWIGSRGAKLERDIADRLGMRITLASSLIEPRVIA